MKDQYDYIVVGAGSSGCALANRLSKDPANSVAIVEAGPPDKSMFIHMPRGIGKILNPGSPLIWEYDVTTGGNQLAERWFRGKTLGGSSSTNGMVYMRGAPLDYDGWAAAGCEGWSWNDVGPKFVELEDHDLGPGKWRGTGGPLHITTHPKGEPLFEAIIKAGEEMGIKRVADVNDVDAVRDGGIAYQTTTRYKGKRFSSARAFLDPIKDRTNLDIITETETLKIEFTGTRATGILVRDKDGTRSIKANKEIIISCGSMQTPKLLQLSGIGPAELLQSVGVPVVVDSPDVGRNMREHRHVDLRLEVKNGSQNKDLSGLRVIWSMLRYVFGRKGPMTHAAHEVGAFAKSDPSLDHADLQFGLMTMSASSTGKESAIAVEKHPGITFVTYFTRPSSQGVIRIKSADPSVPPLVDVNHLSTELDRKKFIAIFHWNRRLAAQPALKNWIVRETYPAETVQSDDEILSHAMELGGTCFHTSGTARMGADAGSVVDPRLRVRGVEGLRVCDTSIFPTMVSGNTNGPAMMAGLRAADLILEDNRVA